MNTFVWLILKVGWLVVNFSINDEDSVDDDVDDDVDVTKNKSNTDG